jgi:uncharacterized delta-60 repeat protein
MEHFSALVVTLLLAVRAIGQPGTLDTGFNGTGTLIQEISGHEDQATGVAATASNGVVIGALSTTPQGFKFAILQRLQNGQADLDFGNSGVVQEQIFPGRGAFLHGLVRRPNGRIIAGGHTIGPSDFFFRQALMQFMPDGSLDPNFGTGGKVDLSDPAGLHIYAWDMCLQTDGKVLLVGSRTNSVSIQELVVTRFLMSGAPDTGFGTNGMFSLDPTGNGAYGWNCTELPDGRIVAVGQTLNNDGDIDVLLIGLAPNGQLDPAFGTNGVVVESADGDGNYYAVEVQNGTHLICTGYDGTGVDRDGLVRRYTLAGILDASFGTGGTVLLDHQGYKDDIKAMIVQPDGKIIVAMEAEDADELDDVVCVRLMPDGAPDATFGTAGFAVVADPADDDPSAMAIQPDGKILIAGTHDDDLAPTGLDVLVHRLHTGLSIGLHEMTESIELEVFPNPATDHITIQCPQCIGARMIVRDALGRELSKHDLRNGISTVHLSDHPPGLLLLDIMNGDRTMCAKLIKR